MPNKEARVDVGCLIWRNIYQKLHHISSAGEVSKDGKM